MSQKHYTRVIGAFAVLVALALAASCRGFFVNQPTSLTVTPSSPTLTSGQQQSFIAQAAFSASTQNVTSSTTWTTSDSCIVAIIGSGTGAGNATDVGTGSSATITASYNGAVGTATASVPTGLTITPCPTQIVGNFPAVVFHAGSNQTFTASGASGTVTWTSSNSGVANITASSGAATFPVAGQATITANDGTNQGTLLITVQ